MLQILSKEKNTTVIVYARASTHMIYSYVGFIGRPSELPHCLGLLHGPVGSTIHVPPLVPSSHNPDPSTEVQAIKKSVFCHTPLLSILDFTTTFSDLFDLKKKYQ